MCAGANSRVTGFLQCLHWMMSGLSSKGRPFGKAARVRSSGVLTRGDVGRLPSVFFVVGSVDNVSIDLGEKGYRKVGQTDNFRIFPVAWLSLFRSLFLDLQLFQWLLLILGEDPVID